MSAPFNYVDQSYFGKVTTDPDSSGGEVYALYEGLLGREPDIGGLESFTAALNGGTSLRDVTAAILASPEAQQHLNASDNTAFVEQLYESVLGRQADTGSLQSWTAALNSGTARADVADSFVFSSEHLADLQPAFQAGIFVPDAHASDVARLYYALLDRAPDGALGLQAYTNKIESGAATLHDVAQGMLNSSEYHTLNNSDYVEKLYQQLLGRHSDASGLQSFTNALSNGASPASIAQAFVDSSEFQTGHASQSNTAYVEALYEQVLGRQGDASGLQSWTAALNSNSVGRVDVANTFVAASEFQTHLSQLGGGLTDSSFVESLYENALGRQADAAGLQAWTGALAHGTSRADVAVAIAESSEAHLHLVSQIEQGWHLA